MHELKPELWGGIECTINRVGDHYFDQLAFAGHYDRDDDLDQIATLGIQKMRFPVLWEKHQPAIDTIIDWRFTHQRLQSLREKNITPIAGLIHHGSGPAFTDLLDENFPSLFAAYAKNVAAEFPWLEYYTPVNEPLTTARFSGLYGHWYPHYSNDISFARMLIHQLKATVLAMAAIRSINPHAKLVQTEDLSKTYCSPVLQFQADFENERRWVTWDMLCGKLLPGMAMYEYFLRLGIPVADLQFFIDHPCPPDIIGVNYYITSERFLDEALDLYPSHTHGGNELLQYADTEAVRVSHEQEWGLAMLLEENYDRFGIPIAITECHLHCTREEQMRWIKECWDIAVKACSQQIPVVGFTCWSLLGAYGWNRLLTHPGMDYETGVFKIEQNKLVSTALVGMIRNLAADVHPLCMQKGWWHRDRLDNIQLPLLYIMDDYPVPAAIAAVCRHRNLPVENIALKDLLLLRTTGNFVGLICPEISLYHEGELEALFTHCTAINLPVLSISEDSPTVQTTQHISLDVSSLPKDSIEYGRMLNEGLDRLIDGSHGALKMVADRCGSLLVV